MAVQQDHYDLSETRISGTSGGSVVAGLLAVSTCCLLYESLTLTLTLTLTLSLLAWFLLFCAALSSRELALCYCVWPSLIVFFSVQSGVSMRKALKLHFEMAAWGTSRIWGPFFTSFSTLYHKLLSILPGDEQIRSSCSAGRLRLALTEFPFLDHRLVENFPSKVGSCWGWRPTEGGG